MAFAFALLHFLLFSTFITFLWFSIATSTPVTSPIVKPSRRFVVNLKARKIIALNRPTARAHLEYDVDLSILAEFSIGEPPAKQLAIVDTGSSLTLVQCFPCKPCVENHFVQFLSVQGPPHTPTSHVLMARVVSIIGTASAIRSIKMSISVGIIEMNSASLALVRQLGDKFSYCIGSLNDPNYKYSQLIIGEGANILGDNTPFTTSINSIKNYYVQLESINIDGKPLDISMAELELDFDGNGGVIIDSSATIIDLNPAAFFPLRNEVKKRMSNFKLISRNNDFLCYEGESSKQSLNGFSTMSFQFAGCAELVLEADSIFFPGRRNNTFCMAVEGSPSISIIGILAQQHYNVGYDLDKQIISLYKVDCELLHQ